jgi:1-acyl-sn-glycerol-3-phosphate acyltransferase
MAMSGRREPWFHAARWIVLPIARVYFAWRFEGLEKIPRTGPVLIACNHASYLDPVANAYAVVKARRRPRFLAKIELFRTPVIGWAMKGTHQIAVDRGTGDHRPLRYAEDALRAGEVVVIYPEGTVTTREDGLPMQGKNGLVRLSISTGVPITPMASWGSAPVWQKSGPGNLRPRRPVWVKVGDPIDLSAHAERIEDRDAMTELTEQVMGELTSLAVDLRDRYPARWRTGR